MFEQILQFLASSLTEGSIYGLVALGLVIALRSTAVLFFAQGAIAMAGGVMMYSLFGQHHLPLAISIPVSLVICVAISLLSLRVVILPLLARGASAMNASMATLGIYFLFEMAAMMIFGKDPLAVPSFSGDEPVTIFGASFVPQHFWIIGFTAIVLFLTLLFFKGTWMGKAMTGLGDNPLLAKASGFPVSRLFMYSFIFAALVAGIAGIVVAPTSYTGYSVGMRLTFKAFIAATVGGITNPLGAIVGGLVIGFFESFTAGFVSSRLKDLITFVLLLVVLRLRPQGLLPGGGGH
jgi:branched-chain amino acid transport system permease protein